MRTTRVWRRRGTAGVAAATLLVGLGMHGAEATGKVVSKKTLAPGVIYEQITDTAFPVREYVLLYDGSAASAAIDQVLSAPQVGTFQKTSVMAANAGAIAGVNGDLNDWPARPTHQYVSNGMPIQTTTPPGVSLGFRQDKHGATITRSPLKIWATSAATKTTFTVSSWNKAAPSTDQVVGYSWYGAQYSRPTTNQCSARLIKPRRVRWNTGKNGTGRNYKVGRVWCSSTKAMTVNAANNVVLSSKLVGKGATFIKSLTRGTRVHVGWSDGTPGAVDVVSGSADVLQNGVIQYASGCRADLCMKNPRTAVGVTATGGDHHPGRRRPLLRLLRADALSARPADAGARRGERYEPRRRRIVDHVDQGDGHREPPDRLHGRASRLERHRDHAACQPERADPGRAPGLSYGRIAWSSSSTGCTTSMSRVARWCASWTVHPGLADATTVAPVAAIASALSRPSSVASAGWVAA